jgi:hypothetical protein
VSQPIKTGAAAAARTAPILCSIFPSEKALVAGSSAKGSSAAAAKVASFPLPRWLVGSGWLAHYRSPGGPQSARKASCAPPWPALRDFAAAARFFCHRVIGDQ